MNKEHILKEIVRTAKENGGIPLGKGKFESETAIRQPDWFGKYWARWSDALIEAGYMPNKKQSAYDEEILIKQVITFIRELGRIPSNGDMRLKAHNNKGFPSHTTIQNRLGGNLFDLSKKILDYCEDKPEYSDVFEICKVVTEGKQEKSSVQNSEDSDIEFGYVYLMKSGRFYKVGNSGNVERRNYDIGIKLPEDLTILHKIKTDDPTGIENYWHTRFRNKRKQGEWFELSNTDITAFKRRKFM
jgi:hypothetical protein